VSWVEIGPCEVQPDMRFPVNLATTPTVTHRLFLTLSSVSVALSGLLFVALCWHDYAARKSETAFVLQSEKATREIESLTDQRARLDYFFLQPENAKLHDRASFINSIIDAQSFDWTRMFMDLEHVLPGGVQVMSIEPKQVNGQATVKLIVGAVSEEAKNNFMHALEGSDVFSDVELISVHEGNQEPDSDPVTLELMVVYSGT